VCLLQEKAECRPQVLLFAFELCHPVLLFNPTQMGFSLLGQGQVIAGMGGLGGLQFSGLSQALQTILADGLQQQQAWLPIRLFSLAQQVVLQQHTHAIEDGVRSHPLCKGRERLEGAAASEDSKTSEEVLLLGRKQRITPRDGGAHGLLAIRQIACSPGQHLQTMREV
jgi:hypothetical protein